MVRFSNGISIRPHIPIAMRDTETPRRRGHARRGVEPPRLKKSVRWCEQHWVSPSGGGDGWQSGWSLMTVAATILGGIGICRPLPGTMSSTHGQQDRHAVKPDRSGIDHTAQAPGLVAVGR